MTSKLFIKTAIIYLCRIVFGAAIGQHCRKHGVKITARYLIDKVRTYGFVGMQNYPKRNEWIKKQLQNVPPGWRILDAGAGELQYKNWCAHLRYTSQDFCQYNGKGTGEGEQAGAWRTDTIDLVSDITAIPVPDGSFDAILCTKVIEHIPYPDRAIQEFSRILRPGGKLIVTAPFCSLTHQAPYYFANGYSRYWYEKILPAHGFRIDELTFNGNFFEYLAQELRRIPDVQFKYTNLNLTKRFPYRFANLVLLRTLSKLSHANKKSEEFLCFGIHALATKQ